MSKRIANTRERTARNGRIRIGWRKKRMLSELEKIDRLSRIQVLEEEVQQKFEEFKDMARKVLPKKLQPKHILRRSQGR